MPKRQRWTTKNYTYAYQALVYRDGEKCALCRRPYESKTSKVERKHGFGQTVGLEIDEKDGNPANHELWNLRLLCRTCNLALGCGWAGSTGGDMRVVCESICDKPCASMERRAKTIKGARGGDCAEENAKERERERNEGHLSTRVVREMVDFSEGSPEMQANSLYEKAFRRFVLDEVRLKCKIAMKDAIGSGSEVCGCSVITAKRYIEKLVSPKGNLQIVIDSADVKWLTWKERLTEEEQRVAI
jgi:hypothetical protein